jgi:UDP-N-acetylglucosamine 4,6-dehydratase/5-epimerase
VHPDEARHTMQFEDKFIITPSFLPQVLAHWESKGGGKRCEEGFQYSSDSNPSRLGIDHLRRIVKLAEPYPVGVDPRD